MTIKEISKTYKRIKKYDAIASEELFTLGNEPLKLSDYAVHAANHAKAVKQVVKVAERMGVSPNELEMHIETEEEFAMWCLLNKLELNGGTDEEETDEE